MFVAWMAVADDFPFAAVVPRLDPSERARAARFARADDRNAYGAAHVLLRHALDRVGGRHPWRFRPAPHGKLMVDGDGLPGLHVSLSHGRGLVAAAVTALAPVGVDVEDAESAVCGEDVAALAFAPAERAALAAARTAERWRETFFGLWTLKEAVVKATGQGLCVDLRRFVLALDPPRLVTAGPDGSEGRDWWLHSARLGRHRLAVALNAGGNAVALRLEEVTPARLCSP